MKEKPIEQPLASLPDNSGAAKSGWNIGSKAAEAEGSAAGAGNLFGKGDVAWSAVAAWRAVAAAPARRDWVEAHKGDGTGGGAGGEALSGLARPLGGYQVKPRYPESARRAGFQGVTTLRVGMFWKMAGSAKWWSNSPPASGISNYPPWKRSKNGSSSRLAGAKTRCRYG